MTKIFQCTNQRFWGKELFNHELIEHEKQRSQDFEKCKDEISQLGYIYIYLRLKKTSLFLNKKNEKLQDSEKSEFKEYRRNESKCTKTIQVNVMMQQRCTEFELKFRKMLEAIKNSNEYIGQFQEMKKTMLKQNKEFRQNKKDLQSKYTQLNAFNEATKLSADTIYRKNETLETLCKNLQQQNDALKDCLKLHGIEFQSQSISLDLLTEATSSSSSVVPNANANTNVDAQSTAHSSTSNKNDVVTVVGVPVSSDGDVTNTDTPPKEDHSSAQSDPQQTSTQESK
ncbi:hypothetical protein RFI_32342 [Reticulomyxa filosa]|uniref:Uncharacterized protein n=1 Tax=Reticulomyxa filosa TaxID=46433 RepID=X6LTT8_RETFI|nr:hypothetical protein RFI_32342 [Reticulomyxa filosa]|eukprot:ETO05054.1 hypothetical protein RFI_32342 [Reticulomyxa filosa]